MNKADSERIATALEKKGYKLASKESEADLILVNMCSVRQSAVDRVYGKIRKLEELKKKNKKLKTILTGCVLKKDKKKFREGFNEIWQNYDFLELLPKYQTKNQAFVPISNGCNNLCTYCVVPFTRGSLTCRNHKNILKEIKEAVKDKKKEIWLLGQNVNDYQSPIDPTINFPKLLKQASSLPGDFQIRFTSPHPKNFTDELIKTMAQSKKISKYLNLPVQSGDDKILKRMNRPYTTKQYKDLINKIRKSIPDINLSTDVIVGFPGETKKQFENTLKLFKEINFNMAYIAKYSPRPGTAAFEIKNNVLYQEKKQREKALRNLLS